jgi:hypothetical protein
LNFSRKEQVAVYIKFTKQDVPAGKSTTGVTMHVPEKKPVPADGTQRPNGSMYEPGARKP